MPWLSGGPVAGAGRWRRRLGPLRVVLDGLVVLDAVAGGRRQQELLQVAAGSHLRCHQEGSNLHRKEREILNDALHSSQVQNVPAKKKKTGMLFVLVHSIMNNIITVHRKHSLLLELYLQPFLCYKLQHLRFYNICIVHKELSLAL